MDDITIDENYDAVKEDFFKGLTFRQTVYAFLTILGGTAAYTILLMVLHLPQIAARGRAHYKVYKKDSDTETNSHIRRLTDEERVEEIAHMLSGATLTEAALSNAKALLNSD